MDGRSVIADEVVVCEYCDAFTRRVALRRGERALCPNCGSPLYRRRWLGLDGTLAVTLTAFVALIIANSYPIMTMSVGGQHSSATFWQAVMTLDHDGFMEIAVVVAVTGLLAPLAQLGLLSYICVPARLGRRAMGAIQAVHALGWVRPWSMVEVVLLSALVATVKLAGMADAAPGLGLFGFVALMLCMAVLLSNDPEQLWDWVET